MQLSAFAGLLLLASVAYAQVQHNGVIYAQGTQVEASKRDTVISRDALRVYAEQRPNALIHGYVTAGGLDRHDMRFLLIRCVIRTNDEPLSRVLGKLSLEMDDPAYFSSWGLKSLNVAITDTIPSNSMRTFVFRQYLNTVTDESDRIIWNHYRLSSNPSAFGWTFTPSYVWKLNR